MADREEKCGLPVLFPVTCFDWRGDWSSEEGGKEGLLKDSKVLDSIIQRLLGVKGSKPRKQVQVLEAEIRQLCLVSRDIFLQQPNLLELEAPIKICGKLYFFPFSFSVFLALVQ